MLKSLLRCLVLIVGLLESQSAKAQFPLNADDFAGLRILAQIGFLDSSNATPPNFNNAYVSASNPTISLNAQVVTAFASQGVYIRAVSSPVVEYRVVGLDLSNRIAGQGLNLAVYPAFAGNSFELLEYLNLSGNTLVGGIDWGITNKPNMRTLILSDNWLGQTAPRLAAAQMPNLDTLIADNFTGTQPIGAFPIYAANLRHSELDDLFQYIRPNPARGLSYLDLSNTYFCGGVINAPIIQVSAATLLDSARINRDTFPFHLLLNNSPNTRIQTIKCSNCNLAAVSPPQGFPNLIHLILDSNAIEHLPMPVMPFITYPSYGLRNNLEVLNLANNNLKGVFPLHWFFGAGSGSVTLAAREIHLQGNELEGIDNTMMLQNILVPINNLPVLVEGNPNYLTVTTTGATTITSNALSLVRLDHNKLGFLDLYNFNIGMNLGISPLLPSPPQLFFAPGDSASGDNYERVTPSITSVYYFPQDSLGIGGVRRRPEGERMFFDLANEDFALGLSPIARLYFFSPTNARYRDSTYRNTYSWYIKDQTTGTANSIINTSPLPGVMTVSHSSTTLGIAVGISAIEFGAPVFGVRDGFVGAYIPNVSSTSLHRKYIYSENTNHNFPKLTLVSRPKLIFVGGCVDNSGAPVRCQEMSIQYDTSVLNSLGNPLEVANFKDSTRRQEGAYMLDSCVCGSVELWGLYDTTQMQMHLQAAPANYGSQTATTASTTRRPGLKSAGNNYTMLPDNSFVQNLAPNDSVAYANANTDKSKTLIAHIDSGVDYDHPSLMRFFRKNTVDNTINGTDNDANGATDDRLGYNFFDKNARPVDDLGHGTQIAGILAGLSSPTVHATGANSLYDTVHILPIRFTNFRNEGTSYNAACGIYYAAEYHHRHNLNTGAVIGTDSTKSQVRVINASWGYQGDSSKLLYDAIKHAGENCNILFVTAAGNDNRTNIDQRKYYPANYKLKNILVVGAIDSSLDRISAYSNLGANNVDLTALGTITQTTDINGQISTPIQGTSFATPMVARAAAILFNKYQADNITAESVKKALLASATRINGQDSSLVRSKGYLNLDAAFAYLDTMLRKNNCGTNINDDIAIIVQVEENTDNSQPKVYPNPTQALLNIDMGQHTAAEIRLQLVDIQGQMLINQHFAQPNQPFFSFDLSHLPNGFYILQIQTPEQQWSVKIIKLK